MVLGMSAASILSFPPLRVLPRVAIRTGILFLIVTACGGPGQQAPIAPPPAPAPPAAPQAVPETPLIPRSVLFGNPERTRPRLSPDGKWVSYLAPKDGVLNVWVAPLDQPKEARVVTKDTSRGIRFYDWAYTSRHLIYAQDKAGDENWRLYSAAIDQDAIVDLTPLEGVQARLVHASHKHPKEVLIGLNDRDKKWHDVYSVDLESGKRTLVEKNPRFGSFVATDDLKIAFATEPTKDGGNAILRKHRGKWLPFAKISMEDEMGTNVAGLSPDAKFLYLTDSRGRDRAALTRITVSSGETKVLAEDLKADVSDVLFHPTENLPQAAAASHLRKSWLVLDPELQNDFDTLLKAEKGELDVVSRSLDDKTWLVSYAIDTGPTRTFAYDRVGKKLQFLFADRPELEKYELSPMFPVMVKARDGLELPCYVTLPRGSGAGPDAKPQKPVPLVLMVHGGPWSRDSFGYNAWHQWLANRGYGVMSVNYRGSVGFGKKFVNAANEQWAKAMHDDLIDAVKWAIDRGVTTRDKVAIMGGSYGGYATLVGLTFTPDTFACGVDIVGPSNLETLLASIPPYWESYRAVFAARVGDMATEAGKKLLRDASPLHRVDAIKKPLLIGQGANDPRVKQAESDQIVEAMKKKNIPVTYVLYPDEGHGFARPENRQSFNAVAEAFLSQCLGGRREPFGKDFEGASLQVPEGAAHVPGLPDALSQKAAP